MATKYEQGYKKGYNVTYKRVRDNRLTENEVIQALTNISNIPSPEKDYEYGIHEGTRQALTEMVAQIFGASND